MKFSSMAVHALTDLTGTTSMRPSEDDEARKRLSRDACKTMRVSATGVATPVTVTSDGSGQAFFDFVKL